MRSGVTTWLMAGALLAGCVGADGDASSDDGSGGRRVLRPGDLDPESGFGAIQGTVASDEAVPIAGAQVAIQDTDFLTVTDANGLFVLESVPPGRHVLLVGALGFEAAAKAVEVVAGEITPVTFIVGAIEAPGLTYADIFHFTGFFECALAVPGWVSACTYPYTAVYLSARDNGVNLSTYGAPPDLQPNSHRFNITIGQDIGQFVGELSWQPTSAAATQMRLNIKCGDYHPVWDDCVYPYDVSGGSIRYGEAVGQSPLRVVIDAEEFYDLGKDKGKWDLAQNPEIWIMNYVSLPHGTTQIAFQQRFDVWDTVFYNGKGTDGYSVLVDA